MALLVAARGRVVRSEVLEDELWEGRRMSDAALRVALNRLRKRCQTLDGFDPVRSEPGGYRLAVDISEIDAQVYEGLAREVARVRRAGDHRRAVALADQADGLWRGPAYDGFSHLPSVRHDADRLEALRLATQEARAATLVQLGDLAAALESIGGLVAEQPLNESVRGLQVFALVRAGRRSHALRALAETARLLDAELGIPPGVELRALERSIIAEEPLTDDLLGIFAPGPPIEVVDLGARRRRPVALAGRSVELEALRSMSERARDRGPVLVTLSGEPGIGKSALIAGFAAAQPSDAPLLLGRCEPTRSVPLAPLLEAFAASIGAPDSRASRALAAVVSEAGAAVRHPDDLDLRRHGVRRAFVDLVVELAAAQTLIVAIDDAQWADDLSLAVVGDLVRDATGVSLMIVLGIRTAADGEGRVERLLGELGASTVIHAIDLVGLDRAGLRELVGPTVDERSLDTLLAASGGNPLYAQQLDHLPGAKTVDLPADVRTLCIARLERLDPAGRLLIGAAAVLGAEFDAGALSSLMGRNRAQITENLHALQRVALLEPADGTDRFRFVHGVIHAEAYRLIEGGRRAHLHLLAAATCEGRSGAEGARAIHLAEARPLVPDNEIAHAATDAGNAALRVGAFSAAERYFRIVIELGGARTSDRIVAEYGLGLGLALVGDLAGSDVRFAAGIEQARQLGRWDLVADGVIGRIRFGVAASIPEAMSEVDRVDEVLGHLDTTDADRRIHLLSWRAQLLCNIDWVQAQAGLAEAASLALELDNPPLARLVRVVQLRLDDAAGADPIMCVTRAEQVLAEAEAAGDRRGAGIAGAMVIAGRLRAGRATPQADVDRFVEHARSCGDVGTELVLHMAVVPKLLLAGPLVAADDASNAITSHTADGTHMLATTSRLLHVMLIRLEQERLIEIEPLLIGALTMSPRRLTRPLVALSRLEAGDVVGGRAQLDVFLVELHDLKMDWTYLATLAFAAEAAVRAGHLEVGRAVEPLLAAQAPQAVVACSVLIPLAHTDHYLGILAALRGDTQAAIDRLASARRFDLGRGARLWAAWSDQAEAAALLDRADPGDAEHAGELADRAQRVAEEFGSARLAVAIAAATTRRRV